MLKNKLEILLLIIITLLVLFVAFNVRAQSKTLGEINYQLQDLELVE